MRTERPDLFVQQDVFCESQFFLPICVNMVAINWCTATWACIGLVMSCSAFALVSAFANISVTQNGFAKRKITDCVQQGIC